MGLNGLGDAKYPVGAYRSTVRTACGPSTSRLLSAGKNCVFSGGDGMGQTVFAEYAPGSTADDPVVHIRGTAFSGDYDETVHLNDLNPRDASYAELCALMGHEKKSGRFQELRDLFAPLPQNAPHGDCTLPQDYIGVLEASVNYNQMVNDPDQGDEAKRLLSLFQGIAQRGSGPSAPEVDLTALKDYLDSSAEMQLWKQRIINL